MDKNGVSLIGNDDMDGIRVWVTNNTPIPVSITGDASTTSKKIKIFPNIEASAFTAFTTLEEIIPNGFMLIVCQTKMLKI